MSDERKTPLGREALESRNKAWKVNERGRQVAAEKDQAPRPLTAEELEVLRWVLEHGGKAAQLFLPQLEGIRAVRWCDCGCPSIRLTIPPDGPKVDGKLGNIVCDFIGTTREDEKAGVLLFQRDGRLDLMEIYPLDAGLYGDTPEYGLPTLESLEFPEWEPVPGFPNVRYPFKSPRSPA
jgi:hypothetical protein